MTATAADRSANRAVLDGLPLPPAILEIDPDALDAVIRAGATRGSRWTNRIRAAARMRGSPIVPIGDNNAKVGSPATYRPVRATCDLACPYLDRGCLAQVGNVASIQQHADPSVAAGLLGYAGCVARALMTGTLVRLHVSGDCGQTPEVAEQYALGMVDVVRRVARVLRRDVPQWHTWGYTHSPISPWVLDHVRRAGIALRQSDRAGPWGVVVGDPADRALRSRICEGGATPTACPEQATRGEILCVDCGICWSRPTACVIFLPSKSSRGGREAMLMRGRDAVAR